MVLISALILALSAVAVPPPSSCEVLRTGGPINVDGVLNEASWKAAQPLQFVDNATGQPSNLKTSAWVLWDDEYLYFAFESYDENIWATMKNRDEHLWTEEVDEVFLQPNPNHPNYIELEVNPLDTMLDIYLIDVRKPLPYESWNPAGIKWAVNVDGTVDGKPGDRKWTCEIAFPLADAVTAPNIPPKDGDTWKMNLYRVESKPQPAGLAWSPTLKRDFHVPARFGDIVFRNRKVN